MSLSTSLRGLMFFSLALYARAPKKPGSCAIPGSPINWVAKYCAFVVETDDEVVIEASPCFKAAERDLKSKDECQINRKYKARTCELLIKRKYTAHKTLLECLRDKTVAPFVAGQ